MAKLRLSAHSLEIERGRYSKKAKTDRICTLCKDNKIEDENHFIWHCPIYKHERELFEYKLSHLYNPFKMKNDISKNKILFQSKFLWFFVSFRIFFSDNTNVRIFFFLSRKARIFFPKLNIRLYYKNSESDYFFFPPPKSEYFFQQHWESEYFFRKKT